MFASLDSSNDKKVLPVLSHISVENVFVLRLDVARFNLDF